ncbi:hypothetical protein CSB37_01450 [bacterium DOLZORAL124_38_8]|nr:MAG: hypothetical protein CSB37_01450 [bacterium DOLZORAL124_38_8]
MPFSLFTKNDLIADILLKVPKANEILLSYGLLCVGCHLNTHETLQDGILGHGYSMEDLENILEEINEVAQNTEMYQKDFKEVELTDFAAQKVQEFQEESNQVGFGFKIEVKPDQQGNPYYILDFLKTPALNDRIVSTKNIKIFLDKESYIFLKNCSIDYIINPETNEEGFKVIKNNLPTA